ncbi:Lactosylceramide 1,3-N-acetyl-beta-D-glucosaminyltransferase [Trichinella papuae]|uniref:Hexosyltransferase n=2 Tax=Trichinella papuae TaxID=268474 RepID=A0A0V1M5C3_9BILA|nr:Lactosylceramide 1,3-N-acetyl-beta-D-glucosaminyltransferase [Trichinella papuae]
MLLLKNWAQVMIVKRETCEQRLETINLADKQHQASKQTMLRRFASNRNRPVVLAVLVVAVVGFAVGLLNFIFANSSQAEFDFSLLFYSGTVVTDDQQRTFPLTGRLSILPNNVLCSRCASSCSCSNCSGAGVDDDYLVIVKSRISEFDQRDAIRRTWAAALVSRIVFVVGRSTLNAVNTHARLEAERFGDILQTDHLDSYSNLSYKSLGVLHWIVEHCPTHRFYVYMDSDVLIWLGGLRSFVRTVPYRRGTIYCNCWSGATIRRSGKHAVPLASDSFTTYPVYCAGGLMIMTGDVPALLLRAHQSVLSLNSRKERSMGYIGVDDAYFTGILADRVGVRRVKALDVDINLNGVPTLHWIVDRDCRRLLATVALGQFNTPLLVRTVWINFNKLVHLLCSGSVDAFRRSQAALRANISVCQATAYKQQRSG